jgi:hypothetical protein
MEASTHSRLALRRDEREAAEDQLDNHGRYTAEAIARRRQLSELIRMARVTLAELKERR